MREAKKSSAKKSSTKMDEGAISKRQPQLRLTAAAEGGREANEWTKNWPTMNTKIWEGQKPAKALTIEGNQTLRKDFFLKQDSKSVEYCRMVCFNLLLGRFPPPLLALLWLADK